MTKEKDNNLIKNSQKSQLNNKNAAKSTKNSFKDKLCDLIQRCFYPDNYRCIVCDKEIQPDSKYCICEDCLKTFPFNNGRICVKCGAPIENEACYCLECQNYEKGFDFARSSLKYEGDAKRLVLNFKFHNNRWLAKYFADMLYDTYMQNGMDADVIIAVPISHKRQKARGYNQSLLIAKPLAERLNLPLLTNVIEKVKENKQQASLSLRERRENVIDVYRVTDRNAVKGKKVLVVDDILTTGSTLGEISRRLKIVGATKVYGLVVASPKYVVPTEYTQDNLDFEIL